MLIIMTQIQLKCDSFVEIKWVEEEPAAKNGVNRVRKKQKRGVKRTEKRELRGEDN